MTPVYVSRGIAFINSTGNLAGFVGPSIVGPIVGLIKQLMHSPGGADFVNLCISAGGG